ncbi:hypothetical protein FKV24_012650 [Lysobacter maris]|uniref:Uncharacterized protein n=1 Tax=Marilutibacter maris TaxID=1605891 RepID=A0A508AMK3_9GAMM|nr:hypothetical protein [Lysobacter maris]KAB8180179.1 hypothetical protein FKV24_012650 [Lysobacter maris]
MSGADQVAELRRELDDLRASFDTRVADRVALILLASSISPGGDYRGMTDAEIRAHAVALRKGHDAIAGKSDAYVEAHFDSLAEVTKVDPVTVALMGRYTAGRRH